MSSVPYMPTYVADLLSDTEDLTNEEFGAYVRLILFSWKKRKPIADDARRIARILRCTPGRWLKKLKPVLLQFFEVDEGGAPKDGKLSQRRLESELRKAEKGAGIERKNREKNAKTEAENAPPTPAGPPPAGGESELELEPEDSSSSLESERGALSRSARAQRLPADFQVPGEWIGEGFAARQRHGLAEVDLDLEAEKFSNHWRSKGGAAGRRTDWHATWINWCLKTEEARGTQGNGRYATGRDADNAARMRAGLARAVAERMDGGATGTGGD